MGNQTHPGDHSSQIAILDELQPGSARARLYLGCLFVDRAYLRYHAPILGTHVD